MEAPIRQRKKRQFISVQCPEGFTETGSGSCWHSSKQSMNYDEAVKYCNDQGNGLGQLLHFLDDAETTELYEILKFQDYIQRIFKVQYRKNIQNLYMVLLKHQLHYCCVLST